MTKIDRTNWPSGEWDNEPDRLEWRVGDFHCLILRVEWSGHLNGYVGVPEGHCWWGQGYDALNEEAVRVHCGLTFAREEGPADDLHRKQFTVGFDCAHCDDFYPTSYRHTGTVYRNIAYVAANVRQLLWAAGVEKMVQIVQVVDGERVEVLRPDAYTAAGTVTGDGADMIRRWVRFGESRLDIIADWIEDHPEHVVGLTGQEVAYIANRMRESVAV